MTTNHDPLHIPMNTNNFFDYIIVGGGASGAILASRLSANPDRTVLLLEAGPADSNPDIADPARFVRLWGSARDWFTPSKMLPMHHELFGPALGNCTHG